jgi:hypothetical protein
MVEEATKDWTAKERAQFARRLQRFVEATTEALSERR